MVCEWEKKGRFKEIKSNKENAMSLNTGKDQNKALAWVKKGENGEKQGMFPVQYGEERLTVQPQPSFPLGSNEL